MAPTQNPVLQSSIAVRATYEPHTRVPLIQGVAIGLVTLAFVICTLRLTIRLKRRTTSYEDGFIAFAMLFSILESAVACLAAQNGYGALVSTLTPEQLARSLMWFWWAQVMYKLTIWPTKLSILFLYLRVFGDTPNVTSCGINFRKFLYSMMIFSAVFCVITLIVNVLTCIPVKHYWDKDSSGHCGVDSFSWWLSQSLLNTISDILILVLPMPLVKNLLQIPARQKVGLCLVFGLGGFVVVVTIMRITTFKTGGLGDDITYDGAVTLCWTMVETNVAIICACLPLLRPFIARMIPEFCGRSGLRSTNSYPMVQPTTTDESPNSKLRSIHVPERMRPRSWVGIETVIGQGTQHTDTDGIHKQMDVDVTTEAVSICGTDSLRRLTTRQDDEITSEESRDSESTAEQRK
ncbi:hypothetical protein AUEXF2481DRAFT_1925 [Aureobasidium subglaciale EXF-2481]|uniref:Rhodopsin domain-containing protein n=1 Tax=Aureobasidium subglaciale (strain EXF-2481) TaxID=1043005 RepID=A0A074YMW3_AURSE|nr:uncharacterized protein AUEXF2481DRAFT_1925 [Aureobasidium subglaciale EXF-2481]KEQ99108.1 hypothetical protein AUEXF2481DRAFT_1925 [Aureobasidium subglaciale EXF-2481]